MSRNPRVALTVPLNERTVMPQPLLAVHGGAGSVPKRLLTRAGRRPYEVGLLAALRAGQSLLLRGASAGTAVIAAVKVLEDCPVFNAGRGSVLCRDGSIELSASFMDGTSGAAGGLAGARRTRNPIVTAAAIGRHPHAGLFGEAADHYTEEIGQALVAPAALETPARRAQWERLQTSQALALDHAEPESLPGKGGTVGAVALDRRGGLAAGTSTGGMVNQWPGRVSDSALIGAGTWVVSGVGTRGLHTPSSAACAISATGTGDAFVRVAFARRLADLLELGDCSPEQAADRALAEVAALGGEGGALVLTPQTLIMPFTSPHMFRGWCQGSAAPQLAIEPQQANRVLLHRKKTL